MRSIGQIFYRPLRGFITALAYYQSHTWDYGFTHNADTLFSIAFNRIETIIGVHKLPALGTLAYAVNDYKDGQTLASEFHRLEKSFDLSPLLLLLALLALAAEGLLANPPPMRARPAAKPQSDLKEETVGIR